LRTLASLPSGERVLAVRALLVLIGLRAALWGLSFPRVRALVEGMTPDEAGEADEAAARAVRRAVDRAARTMPGTACLAQALTAEVLLRRGGHEARVVIGVAPDGQPLDAHAWVESAGVLVTGDTGDLERYRTLTVFESPRASLPPASSPPASSPPEGTAG
jgi:hypothetical protein